MVKSFVGLTYSFSKSRNGKNCPEDEIITTEGMCITAAKELGLIYKNSDTKINFPAGCHFSKDGVVFNEIISPVYTNPELFVRTGGICFTRGLCFIIALFRQEQPVSFHVGLMCKMSLH